MVVCGYRFSKYPGLVLSLLLIPFTDKLYGDATELASYECARLNIPVSDTFYNVRLACRALYGTVLRQGQIFSFNEITNKVVRYYGLGPTVEGGHTVLRQGGGICQVSTALYQAALRAGLEIVEQYPHSAFLPTIDYCKKGEDAAISRPYKDLKLRNNKPFDLQIEAYTRGNQTVIIKIVRKKD